MNKENEVVIVSYGRSPVCRARKGGLKNTHAIDWSAQVLKGVLEKTPQINKEEIEDIIVGCAMPVKSLNLNAAKLIAQRAGIPDCVPAQTINRFCASGLQSIATCANAILSGQNEIMIAGGVEDMTHTFKTANPEDRNQWLLENVPGAYMPMGITAENVALKYGIDRDKMDLMAYESHRKADTAQKNGNLNRSIIPVTAEDDEGNSVTISLDDGIRKDITLESVKSLKPCFKQDGIVTAATSSQTSDGAAFTVLMNKGKAEALGIKPIAKFLGFAVAGCPPEYMGIGPTYAVPKLMKKTGLSIEDMDIIELNEAFAAQALYCIQKLRLPKEKVNPWGGAMALGHPMGATGIVLMSKALDYLEVTSGRYALVTMCIGGGMGAAAIFERI